MRKHHVRRPETCPVFIHVHRWMLALVPTSHSSLITTHGWIQSIKLSVQFTLTALSAEIQDQTEHGFHLLKFKMKRM